MFRILIVALLLGMVVSPVYAGTAETDVLWEEVYEYRNGADYESAIEATERLILALEELGEYSRFELATAKAYLGAATYNASLPKEQQYELAIADSYLFEIYGLHRAGNIEEAEEMILYQKEVRERLLPPDAFDLTTTYGAYAELLVNRRKFTEARDWMLKSLEINKKHLGELHNHVATQLKNIGDTYFYEGDYVEAAQWVRKGLGIVIEMHPGEEGAYAASFYNDLSVIHRKQGDYATSLRYARKTVAIVQHELGEYNSSLGVYVDNLSKTLLAQGDLFSAERASREALRIRKQVHGEGHHLVARNMSNLAEILRRRGDYASAETLLKDALRIREERLGHDHYRTIRNKVVLGVLFREMGRFDESEEQMVEALELQKANDPKETLVGTTYRRLSKTYRLVGRLDEAIEMANLAIEHHRTHEKSDHPELVTALRTLASAYREKGDHEQALGFSVEALGSARKAFRANHPDLVSILKECARSATVLGEQEEAQVYLAEAAQSYEAARLRAGEGFVRATALISPYEQLATNQLQRQEMTEAWLSIEQGRARALEDLVGTNLNLQFAKEDAARVRDLGVALGDMERRLEALQVAADRDKDSRVAGRARTAAVEMRKIENQWDALQKELSSKYGNSHHGLTSIEGIASQLDGNSAIVGWHESSSTGLAWGYVLRAKGGVTWIQLENSDPAAGNRTKAFRKEMHRVSSWPMRVTETEKADKAGADLWSFFVEPLLPELANVENLIVIPSGSLLGIPIEALQSPTGEYLSDRFAVSYSPSATVYALLASRKDDSSVDPGTALLVGDPPFRASHVEDMRQSELAASAADADAITDEGLVGQAVLRGALGGNQGALSKLPRLPRSRDEIIEIAKAFEKPTVLLGPDAAEQKLSDLASQDALAGYQTIHLATHALVDEEAPERSALVLSRVELPDPMDALVKGDRIYDGMVTISEISREWNLSADLVTLSGCQTALGRESGGEGYIGFAQAFLQAGAQSLLVSLWKVDDLATAKLMSRFYQNLAEGERGAMTKQKALQEAKSWLRNYEDTSGAKPFQHPAYWAGFVLMGNAN